MGNEYVMAWSPRTPIEAVPFRNTRTGALVHNSSCVDEEGKVECVCGLEELEDEQAEAQLAAAEREGRFD